MTNKVYNISKREMDDLKEELKKDNYLYIVEVDGNTIQSLQDYLNAVNEKFDFPIPVRGLDGYLDWIRDLEWLEKEKYVFIINNFKNYIKEDLNIKDRIIKDLEKIVLPWWQEEVEECVVDGKAKPFNVYLVD